jgi:integrase
MASLQARHSRSCPRFGSSGWTPYEDARQECACTPRYYVVIRDGAKVARERVGRDRKIAEAALRKIAVQVDEGEYRARQDIRFKEWADRWLSSLEREETTRDSYRSTLEYAKQAFGDRIVRRLSVADVRRFNDLLAGKKLSSSTRAKHLRVLHGCLGAAVPEYAARNPVRELPKNQKPRPVKKESAYFESSEIPALFQALPHDVNRVLLLTALKTGMRLGELLALTWGDVDLQDETVRVRRSLKGNGTVGDVKNHELRSVDITADLVTTLGEWWGECEAPSDNEFVFAAPDGGHLIPTTILRRVLYPAMVRAEIPRVGPTGEKRTFHSLRHSFAKRALESGRRITWLSRHLGHSSVTVTLNVYGHWEAAERKREAQQMQGVFGV